MILFLAILAAKTGAFAGALGLGLLPFALGNLLPVDPESEEAPVKGNEEGIPSAEELTEAVATLANPRAEEGEEEFETEADRKAKAEAAGKLKPEGEGEPSKLPNAASDAEILKRVGLEGKFENTEAALKSFGEVQSLLDEVTKNFGGTTPEDTRRILTYLSVYDREHAPAAAATTPEKKEPAAAVPAELSAEEKNFLAANVETLGLTEEAYKGMKGFIIKSILSDPEVKKNLLADVLPTVQNLQKTAKIQMEEGFFNQMLQKFPKEKYPEIHELRREELDAHLQKFPELYDLAVRRGQNPFEMAAVDKINRGGLMDVLEKAKKAAAESGAAAGKRLEVADRLSSHVQPSKETHGKPEVAPEDKDPEEELLETFGSKKRAEDFLLNRK